MKELSEKEKAQRYDEAIERAKGAHNSAKSDKENGVTDKITEYTIQLIETIFPELKESEDERIRKELIEQVVYIIPNDDEVDSEGNILPTYQKRIDKYLAWLEKQGEQKPSEWHREDEQNLNACLGYIPDEFLRRWLTDIIHVKYDKSVELPKGEDYGIDGLYAAVDILKKTLGKVDGYQSDDGILEHKCAISAVKKLYEQNPWSEEDEKCIRLSTDIIDSALRAGFCVQLDRDRCVDWLKSLKDRYTWKPTGEQMGIIAQSVAVLKVSGHDELGDRLGDISEQLNKLKG